MTLTVVTYNVHRCVGGDGQKDPERVGEVLRETGPDLVACQEVESLESGDPLSHQARHLAGATGLTPVPGITMRRASGDYGNLLLAAGRIQSVRHHDLSVRGREPRGALDVTLSLRGTPARVVITHLGVRSWERRRQVPRLLALADPPAEGVFVLMGDVNEWWGRSTALRRIEARLGRPPAPRSYPSFRPFFALDRIWTAPRSALESIRAHDTPLARAASDHLPVVAQVRPPRGP